VEADSNTQTTCASDKAARQAFRDNKHLPDFDTNMPRAVNKNWPVQIETYS